MKHRVYTLDKTGKQISHIDIDDYPTDMVVGDDGNIYLAFEKVMNNKKNTVEIYSKKGEKIASMEVGYYPSFVKLGDGSVCVLETDDNDKKTMSMYDFIKGQKIAEVYSDFFKNTDYYGLYDGYGKYQFYVLRENELLGYSSSQSKLESLLVYDLDKDKRDVFTSAVLQISENRLAIVESDKNGNNIKIKNFVINK